jgi:hypothetical protein
MRHSAVHTSDAGKLQHRMPSGAARLPLWLVCFFMGGGSSQNPRGNKIAEIMETKSLMNL